MGRNCVRNLLGRELLITDLVGYCSCMQLEVRQVRWRNHDAVAPKSEARKLVGCVDPFCDIPLGDERRQVQGDVVDGFSGTRNGLSEKNFRISAPCPKKIYRIFE